MRNLTIAVAAVVLFCVAAPAKAVTVDVEDMLLDSSFAVGASFTTGGLPITVGEFNLLPSGTAGGTVTVKADGAAGGAGNELYLNNVNLAFDFGVPIDGVAIQYGDGGGSLNLTINDDFRNFQDFLDVDNVVVGGVQVFVVDAGGTGALFVVGPISMFSIGGEDLSIDSIVANCIPEPATLALLSLGGLTLLRRRNA